MSFWPFRHSNIESNINNIVNDYIHVLHSIEPHHETKDDLIHLTPERYSLNPEDQQVLHSTKSGTSISRLSPSPLFLNVDSSRSQELLPLDALNDSFIHEVLREPDFLDELIKQNKKLIDFLCFGYYYNTEDTLEKHSNIDYLIDRLLTCLDQVPIQSSNKTKPGKLMVRNETNDLEDDILMSIDEQDRIVNSETDNHTQDYEDGFTQIETMRESFDDLIEVTRISDMFVMNIPLINDIVVEDNFRMLKFWSIIKHPKIQTENSIQLIIFIKIQESLLSNESTRYLNFIRQQDMLVDDILNHVNLPILLDFLISLIATDKSSRPTGIIYLVHEQNLVNKCLRYFNNVENSTNVQSCVCDFLKMLIELSTNVPQDEMSIGPNILIREFCSQDTIDYLINIMIEEKGIALCNIVTLVIELIRKNNSDFDPVSILNSTIENNPPNQSDPISLYCLIERFTLHLPSLLQIIVNINNDDQPSFLNQIGIKYKQVGIVRVKIAELVAELLHCSNMESLNSKKAEHFESYRNNIRDNIGKGLKESLMDDLNEKDEETWEVQPSEPKLHSDRGRDSIIRGPYVCKEQNDKIRGTQTIGDLFKIKLFDSQILPKLLNIFMDHPWNNFWHNVIFDILQQLFNGPMDHSFNPFLVYSLFNFQESQKYIADTPKDPSANFNIIQDFVLKGYRESYNFNEQHAISLGYVGHLVLVAEEIEKFSKMYQISFLSQGIQELLNDQDWLFFTNDILSKTRMMYSKILGGGYYIDNGHGRLVPQIPEINMPSEKDQTNMNDEEYTEDSPNYETEGKDKSYMIEKEMTQSDLHEIIGNL